MLEKLEKIEKKMSDIIYNYQFNLDKEFPWSDIHAEVVKLHCLINKEKENIKKSDIINTDTGMRCRCINIFN